MASMPFGMLAVLVAATPGASGAQGPASTTSTWSKPLRR
jgi:hypothetical protein